VRLLNRVMQPARRQQMQPMRLLEVTRLDRAVLTDVASMGELVPAARLALAVQLAWLVRQQANAIH